MITAWENGTRITVHRKLTSKGYIVWYCRINDKDEGGFMTKDEAEIDAWLRIPDASRKNMGTNRTNTR